MTIADLPLPSPLSPLSFGLLGVEPWRAAFEYVGMHLMDRSVLARGDGHPVVVFPGLATDRRALAPLRHCCEQLGYQVHDWELGFNTGLQGSVDEALAGLATHVEGLAQAHGRSVSLIGWSLGGIYAREIAKLRPSAVRQVMTLGTPIHGPSGLAQVGGFWGALDADPAALDSALAARLRVTPGVPTSSIYSRSDGVVAWEACVLGSGRHVENIEVEGSHLGLPWNPTVLRVVADRLAVPEGHWRRFKAPN